VFFIGYWRSGHTALAAVLNGHPDVLLAHELDFFRWLALGLEKPHLIRLIQERDRWFEGRGRRWESYDYNVPGGSYEQLPVRVLGDKMAAVTTQRIAGNIGLLDTLRKEMSLSLRAINVVRNPYDNIATACRKSSMTLNETIDSYEKVVGGRRARCRQSRRG